MGYWRGRYGVELQDTAFLSFAEQGILPLAVVVALIRDGI
jgi:hypothetical protein